jgi:anti-anti-sigma factor
MSERPGFSVDEDGIIRLSGDITLQTVSALYEGLGQATGDTNRLEVVDLKEVRQVDSAALALLLEWKARKLQQDRGNTQFRVTNTPSSLIRLAQLCEAVDLLNMSGRD